MVFRGNFVMQDTGKTSNAQGIYATDGNGLFRYYNNVFHAGDTTSNGLTFRRLAGDGTVQMVGNTACGARSYSLFEMTETPDPVFKNNIAHSPEATPTAARLQTAPPMRKERPSGRRAA
jgi:hypothetical protein